MDVEVTRRQFTTDEYLRMIDAQIFDPDDHLELIEGDVLEMAPVGPHGVVSPAAFPDLRLTVDEVFR